MEMGFYRKEGKELDVRGGWEHSNERTKEAAHPRVVTHRGCAPNPSCQPH